MATNGRFKNSRVKAMLEICNDRCQPNVVKNKENQPPRHQRRQSSTEVCKKTSSGSTKYIPKHIIKMVNSLYAADYSMTSSIFNKLNETKTSLDLGLDFSELVYILSADQLPNLSIEMSLICKEIMPPMSSSPMPSHSSSVLCDNSYINDNRTEILSPTRSNHSPSVSVARLPNVSKEMSLTCDEIMPPMLSSPCLSRFSSELHAIHINDNRTEILSPTRSNHSPSGDFSSDDSVKDKDYYPCNETSSDDDDDDNGQSKPHQKSRQKPISPTTDVTLEPRPENNSMHPETGSSSGIVTAANESTNENRITMSVKEKKIKKKQEKILCYNVKIGCDEKCCKKCSNKFTTDARESINKKYWDLSWKERRIFIQQSTSVAIPKRKITSEPRRAPRSTFTLKHLNGTSDEVCKVFFLTTLGFHKNNDTVLYNSLNKAPVDRRGLHIKTVPKDRRLLTEHVESFHPLEPHYRREHAPLRRYIACDVSVTMMHKDFCEKYASQKVSYEFYRKHVKSMNISFAKLGNEECEVCEAYELHTKDTAHDAKNIVPDNCEACNLYICHKQKYTKARNLYESHKKNVQNCENIYYSVDLQKVIMLPRLDSFKSIIFCPRLTTFNLTFAPVGKITSQHKPLACIWHDGISGRKQEDIMSCYYYFILQHRDVKHITIWMDNCSAQNKNWLLFSLFIFLINSDLIATETITFQYFEPGHTFMSCDQFHHQVELSMKKKGKLYDFQDFTECVAFANLARVDVKTMEPKDFFNFQNYVSDRRIQTSSPRVYLKDIIVVCFQRKSYDILYKTEVDDPDYKVLRFMTDRYLKHTDVLKPEFKSVPKGIDKARKDAVINALKDISVLHKMKFWYDMPECVERVSTAKGNRSNLYHWILKTVFKYSEPFFILIILFIVQVDL